MHVITNVKHTGNVLYFSHVYASACLLGNSESQSADFHEFSYLGVLVKMCRKFMNLFNNAFI